MPASALTSRRLPVPIVTSFALLALMVSVSLGLALRLTANLERLTGIVEYRGAVAIALNLARDAEIGQRGYLVTGEDSYLAPYRASVGQIAPLLAGIATMEGARGRDTAAEMRPLLAAKVAEMQQTVDLASKGQRDAAIAVVRTDRGKALMDRLRVIAERERVWGIDARNRVARNSQLVTNLLIGGLTAGAIAVILLSLMWLRQSRAQYGEVDGARRIAEAALERARTEADAREASEERVRQLQKMESIGQLTGGIAHDFNNMLAVVMGGIELAKRRLRSDPDRAETSLEHAREGATRAATLTARLLAFSRNQPLAPTPLDVNKLVGGMCDMLGRTLGDEVQVECVYGAGLWRCYADPNEVENAILNLSINGRDAMVRGGKLTVETANAHIDDEYARTRADVHAGQYVMICVTDTGTGMSQDVIDCAFDPFFTTKAVGKGTGLGLSQVFGFAKQSGGHAAIYSEVGQGTTVKLYLPRFHGADPGQVAHLPAGEISGGQASEIILVVEDEQRVRHFAVDALRELGYTAISAATPAEALDALDEQPEITMLFTDIVMPEMNGRELADAARAKRGNLKILFTTGYTRNAVVHNGMIDIGIAFLPKPYSMGDLARKIRDVLDGRGVNRSV